MNDLHENYYLRKHYFATNDVPTQSIIKNKMGRRLAAVYFKTMPHNVKVFAGLEPKMMGGGSDWFVPPSDLLKGRAVLRPVDRICLSGLKHTGFEGFGSIFINKQKDEYEHEKNKRLAENNQMWKARITDECNKKEIIASQEQKELNSLQYKEACATFTALYRKSLTQIDELLNDSARHAIERIQEETFNTLNGCYERALQRQVAKLIADYDEIMTNTNEELKNQFITKLNINRQETLNLIHGIKVEKHNTTEKLKHFFECKRLACQVYVAANEKLKFQLEMEPVQREHDEAMHSLQQELRFTERKIVHSKRSREKGEILKKIWQVKVRRVVRKLQTFVCYCLKSVPDYCDFFINMEKLMLLQIEQTLSDSKCESIIQEDEESEETVQTPKTKCHQPFVIFGDINQTSENKDTDTPLFVINKHYVYGSCENAKEFYAKLYDFADMDLPQDNTDYSFTLPVKYELQDKLREQELESSLMQIIQSEKEATDKYAGECCICSVKHKPTPTESVTNGCHSNSGTSDDKRSDIKDKYLYRHSSNFISHHSLCDSCKCMGLGKRILSNYPPYMMKTLPYTDIEMRNYERCTQNTLRQLVKVKPIKDHNIKIKVEEKTKEIGTQYDDVEYDAICNCHCNDDFDNICKEIAAIYNDTEKSQDVVDKESTLSNDTLKTFAMKRAHELKDIIGSSQHLKEIFMPTRHKY